MVWQHCKHMLQKARQARNATEGHRLLSERTLAAQQQDTWLDTPAQTPKTEDMNKCCSPAKAEVCQRDRLT